MRRAYLAFVVVCVLILLLCGCSARSGVHWYAPATWPVFSGASEIERAKKAEGRTERARAEVTAIEAQATHAAHLEFHKAYLSALQLPREVPAAAFTVRTLGNGLGILAQFDPLTAEESSAVSKLVADILSQDAQRVAKAEAAQAAAEKDVENLSRALTAANEKIVQLERAERAARSRERESALENLELANELRTQRARFWIVVGVTILLLGFSIYARLALGGVGAALHAAGAPVGVIRELDANLSTFGQWLVRTGRQAAAKTEAALKARLTGPAPS